MVATWFTVKYRYSRIADNACKVTSVTDMLETVFTHPPPTGYRGGFRTDLYSLQTVSRSGCYVTNCGPKYMANSHVSHPPPVTAQHRRYRLSV